MARAIDGGVPKSIMDRTATGDWNAQNNTIGGIAVNADETMGLARYERWIEQFNLAREFDAHYPDHPTAIARKFELAREMSEKDVQRLLTDLLDHPMRKDLAGFCESVSGEILNHLISTLMTSQNHDLHRN